MNKQSITLFRGITQDFTIPDSEIQKFLKWGNNDMQQALNYYYHKIQKNNQGKEKSQGKHASQQKLTFKKQESKQESKISQKRNEEEEVTVFGKMKKASIKQKKTEEFIQRVRKQYQLPINGKAHPSTKNQKQELQDEYEVEEEFKCADYLGSVFNNQNNVELLEDDSEDSIDEFNENSVTEELKAKIREIQVIQIETINLSEISKPKLTRNRSVSKMSFSQNSQQSQFQQGKEESQSEYKPKNKIIKPKPKEIKPKTKSKEINIKKIAAISKNTTKSLPKFQMADSFEKMQVEKKEVKPFEFLNKSNSKEEIKVPIPNEIYVGEYFFQGFKTDTKPFPQGLEVGHLLEYKHYIEPEKKAKGIKGSKVIQKSINMRICFQNTQICRVEDHEARIFVPLITQNMIKLQVFLFELPYIINTFSKVKFRAKVYLKKKAITEPVVETFDGQSEDIVNIYKGIRDELAGMLQRLNPQVKTYPLIKKKSKFTKNHNNLNRMTKDPSLFEKKAMQFQKKEQEEMRRKQNDPFFKVKQINLADMMKSNSQTASQTRKPRQFTPPKLAIPTQQFFPNSQVKKKVIQLDTIQQNKFAQLIDLYEQNVEPIYPTTNFKSQLYHYQAVALAWMLKREGKNEVEDFYIQPDVEQIHPLWTEYLLPQDDIGEKRSLYYNELTAQLSLSKPYMKNKCKGGILADEMGLGKTVMMAALIASGFQKTLKRNQAQNLVVVPLTLLSQWQSQIRKHAKNISVVCYYTTQRHKLIQQLGRYNVVITTYGTISHEFTKMSKLNRNGLYKYKWKRIILDQAHYIKGRIIQTSKAVYSLDGECRWCLTGTPIQNGLNDLFSLLHFIRYTPWSEFQCWSKYIIKPHESGDQNVYEVLRTLLKRVFLRRTKNSKDQNGKSIIELPKKISKIQVLEMNPKEREFYDMVYESTKAKIDELDKLGIITARYMQVLQILIKLRQVCCHPLLFKSVTKFITNPESFENQLRKFVKKRQAAQVNQEDESENYYQPLIEGDQQIRVEISQENKKISESFLKEIVLKVQKDELENCLICLDNVEEPVITCCLHIFCKDCMIRQIEEFGTCATCRKRISKEDYMHLPRENRFGTSLDSEEFTRSTKMIALMEHLKRMKEDDKAVVFSQFLGMMDLLQHDIKKNNIRYVRMQGSTPQKQRAKIISEFTNNPQIKVFLVSLKTAGVGLNLVAANKVFLMDPWWNPGVQDQAIQRVHRIGQKKQVEVVRFIMDKTIEMRMIELNNEKKNLSQMILSHKDNDSDSRVDKLRYLMEKY